MQQLQSWLPLRRTCESIRSAIYAQGRLSERFQYETEVNSLVLLRKFSRAALSQHFNSKISRNCLCWSSQNCSSQARLLAFLTTSIVYNETRWSDSIHPEKDSALDSLQCGVGEELRWKSSAIGEMKLSLVRLLPLSLQNMRIDLLALNSSMPAHELYLVQWRRESILCMQSSLGFRIVIMTDTSTKRR